MVVVAPFRPRDTEQLHAREQLEDETAETPDVCGVVNSSREDSLGGSETSWHHGLFWEGWKEICYRTLLVLSLTPVSIVSCSQKNSVGGGWGERTYHLPYLLI